MKRILMVLIISVTVWGCASKTETPNYYQLQYGGAAYNEPLSGDMYIWVAPVRLNRFLNDSGIVYQLSDVEYSVARNNLWTAPLARQLQESLAEHLRHELGEHIVLTERIFVPEITVSVYVDSFHGRHDGKAIVSGEWVIQKTGGSIVVKSFETIVTQEKDGYSSLVKALSEGWAAEAKEISGKIADIAKSE